MQVKQLPILFSTDMVRANLAGLKSMTRRTRGLKEINQEPSRYQYRGSTYDGEYAYFYDFETSNVVRVRNPYGNPGDILWVRENWQRWGYFAGGGFAYQTDFIQKNNMWIRNTSFGISDLQMIDKWRPSIHMPYDACRLFLERTSEIRCERLHDITREDAVAEGIERWTHENGKLVYRDYFMSEEKKKLIGYFSNSISSFLSLWKKINGEESLLANPWVWVVGYRKTEKPKEASHG